MSQFNSSLTECSGKVGVGDTCFVADVLEDDVTESVDTEHKVTTEAVVVEGADDTGAVKVEPGADTALKQLIRHLQWKLRQLFWPGLPGAWPLAGDFSLFQLVHGVEAGEEEREGEQEEQQQDQEGRSGGHLVCQLGS